MYACMITACRTASINSCSMIGSLQGIQQVEQGRFIHGHCVFSSVSSLAGPHKASRDGPLASRTDTNRHEITEPSHTTPKDTIHAEARPPTESDCHLSLWRSHWLRPRNELEARYRSDGRRFA
jgi:hypothetical protein